jgi:hypothetical protein
VLDRGRHAAISIWMENLPYECELNNLEVLVDRTPGTVFYVGPSMIRGLQQVNSWLPKGVRTGLVPVQLLWNGQPVFAPTTVRIIPAGRMVPRIVSITDGVNLVQKNASSTGLLKIQIEEIDEPESIKARIGDRPIARTQFICIDPRPPRYEVDLWLPEGLPAGRHRLEVMVGDRRLLPADIDIQPAIQAPKPSSS